MGNSVRFSLVTCALLATVSCGSSADKNGGGGGASGSSQDAAGTGGANAGGAAGGQAGGVPSNGAGGAGGAAGASSAQAGGQAGGVPSSGAGGAGGAGAAGAPGGAGGAAGAASVSSATLNVDLESDNAASADIPITGGSISATGSDGTVYQLVIPPNALDETTTITITPARADTTLVGDAVSSSLGVRFDPQGLFFWQPATLNITPAAGSAPPLERQLLVKWEGDGDNLGLAPVDASTTDIKIFVDHFSGVSIFDVKGVDSKLSNLDQWIADTQDEQFRSRVAEVTQLERNGDSPVDLESSLTGDLGNEYIADALEPRIADAGTSCAHAKLAIQSALLFSRDLGLVGAEDEAEAWAKRAFGVVPTLLEVCMREEYEICQDEHVLDRIIPARVQMNWDANFAGLTDDQAGADKLDSYVRGCLRFKVALDGFAGEDASAYKVEQAVKVDGISVNLLGSFPDWVSPTWDIGPAASLDSVTYTAELKDTSHCNHVVSATGEDSGFTLTSFDFKYTPKKSVDDFFVRYTFDQNQSNFTSSYGCDTPIVVDSPPINWTLFEIIITAQKNPRDSNNTFLLKNWSTAVSDDVVGTNIFAYSVDNSDGSSGDTDTVYNHDVFTIHHTPGL
jgi:hypothetical protein